MEIVLNQSRVQCYVDCPRKFYWQFVENLVPDMPNVNLEIGSAVHEALAELGAGTPLEEAIEIGLDRYEEKMPKRRLPGDDIKIEAGRGTVERILRAYVAHYGEENLWKPLGNEVAGTVEIGEGTGVFLRCRIDKIVNFRGTLWIVDHKTAAKLDMRDVLKYEMDLQMTAYIYAATKLLGQRVMGVIVDVLVKTMIPQFHREAYQRTQEELDEFVVDFCAWASRIAEETDRARTYAEHVPEVNPKLAFPKNTKECFRFGTCAYRPLCLQESPALKATYGRRELDYVDDPSKIGAPVRNKGAKGDVQGR